ncbi:hypothetical protein QOT17_009283 [Balamuthia mandrillaris]
MVEQPSEAQKIAVLKCCLNPCLLESVSNILLSQNAEKYDVAVQIALSVEANLYAHKAPSSTSCPLHPTSGHSAAECKRIKQMRDSTQTPSKASTSQHHNGNNNGSSSSSSSSSGHPLSSNKHTCRKCSAPWHPGHQCKPRQLAALNSSQAQTSSSQQLAPASSPPSSPFPSPATPPPGTNQQSTNTLDATTKQEQHSACCPRPNSLLHSGNTPDSTADDSSPAVIPEAIHAEGLHTDDDDDVEDDCKDKVEPPITTPILLNRQHATAFIDSANSKIDPKFLGPFIIHHCTNNGAYVLQHITGDILPDKAPPSALKPMDPNTPFEDKHYEVEKILDHDGPPSDHYYLVERIPRLRQLLGCSQGLWLSATHLHLLGEEVPQETSQMVLVLFRKAVMLENQQFASL